MITYRLQSERFVTREAEANLPTQFGNFKIYAYKNHLNGQEYAALVKDDGTDKIPLIRVHSECITGDIFHSLKCDCNQQLHQNSVVQFSPFYCSNYQSPGRSVRCVRDTAERSLPEVSTNPVSAVTMHTALCGGVVTYNGGAAVTERGICWGTSPMPSIAGSHILVGADTGTFSVTLTNLQPATAYYVRAYAVNSVGTAYGNDVAFTTPLCTAFDTVLVLDACDSLVWQGETYTSTGDYRFVLSTIEGCDSIVTLQLTIHYSVDTAIYLNTAFPFIWNGIWCDTTGVYTQSFQDMYGCDSTVTLYLTVGLQELGNADGSITVYPNPTIDRMMVQVSPEWAEADKTILLYDSYGRMVLQSRMAGDRGEVNVESLASGVYVLRMTVNGRFVGHEKIVKQ